jgi:hypothetical protein
MQDTDNRDWELGEKTPARPGEWAGQFEWVEEPEVSPDGERLAAVVNTGEDGFTLCVNGVVWENLYERVWYPRFAPDGRLTALAQRDGQSVLCVDGEEEGEWHDFLWDTLFSGDGGTIACAAQNGGAYSVVKDGTRWEEEFFNLSGLAVSPEGSKCVAVVQVEQMPAGDITKFQEGCYKIAINGKTPGARLLSAWDTAFSKDGAHAATEVRVSPYDYTIAVDGVPWEKTFPGVWRPRFNPKTGLITAPVKIGSGWTLAAGGEPLWDRLFTQLWRHKYSGDGSRAAAVIALRYGRWSVAVDGVPWENTYGDFVDELALSSDGSLVACIASDQGRRTIVVNDRPWTGAYDMVWPPVISPDGRRVAAVVESGGKTAIAVDGAVLASGFLKAFPPVFGPGSDRVLVRAIHDSGGKALYVRKVLQLDGPR